MNSKVTYISVLLPLAVPEAYLYAVPTDLMDVASFGKRVEVSLRNKLYSGIIVDFLDQVDVSYKVKKIISVIDSEPIIKPYQYRFWKWMAKYYCCYEGEVMHAALPSALKLTSETKIIAGKNVDEIADLEDDEYLVAEAVSIQNELTIQAIRDILDRKTVYPIIRSLIDKEVLTIDEELLYKYKPRMASFVKLEDDYKNCHDEILNLLKRSNHQTNAYLAYEQLNKNQGEVAAKAIQGLSGVSSAVLKAVEKKGIWIVYKKEVSRLEVHDIEGDLPPLAEDQQKALHIISDAFDEDKPALLHGVTGSGKTRVYMELIRSSIAEGGQVLYLLPEIALTTQIVERVSRVFGSDVGVFHSRMNNHERVELWNEVMLGKKVIIGPRSALFLPFENLSLIIVDEEHDGSYKQIDPSPRYNARDAAIYLSMMLKCNIILGSATPSLESYVNAINHRYALVELSSRFGDVKLPEWAIIDLAYMQKTRRMKSMFSMVAIDEINKALDRQEQVIIFQNRRGFSPVTTCKTCGWNAECKNCDVTLTYHKYSNESRCHLCGYRTKKPIACPKCGNEVLEEYGYGTEKIEQTINQIIPTAKTARLDYDSTRTKASFSNIMSDFENREIDILIGTQMVTKGLDFDNIGLVTIVNADAIFRRPNFRADERAFQIITQVAGRSGRRDKRGKVLLQTYSKDYPLLKDIIKDDYQRFAQYELADRKRYGYPPYIRMIDLDISHRKHYTAYEAADYLAKYLQYKFKDRIMGPIEPSIARSKGFYHQHITIKIERKAKVINDVKRYLLNTIKQMKDAPGFKSVRVKIDVDPY